jgi:hypothetical protein
LRTKFTTNYFGNPRPYWNKDFDIGAYEIEDTQLKLSFLGDPNLTEVTFDVTSYGTHWEYDGINWIKSTDQGLSFASVTVKPKQLLHEFDGMILKWMNRSITYPYPKISSAFYKISTIVNNEEKFIYLDLRDAITTYGPNVYIRYNFDYNRFQYHNGSAFQPVANGSVLRVWNITNNGNFNTLALDQYKDNVLIEDFQKDNHPWIMGGPFSNSTNYTLWRKDGDDEWKDINNFSDYEYLDTDLLINGSENPGQFIAQYEVRSSNLTSNTIDYLVEFSLEKKNSSEEAPISFQLFQNYPNPFNPSTTISFSIAKQKHVILKLYNTLGQEVKTLINEKLGAGIYEVKLDASNLSSGVYIYKIIAGDYVETKKMQLLK